MIDMKPSEIRVELMRHGVKQKDIADHLDVDPGTISRVVDGKVVSDRIRKEIARRIKMDVRFVWPNTYVLDGGLRTRSQKP